jgi:hypothetical protein
MGAEIVACNDGIVTVVISGLLAPADWVAVQKIMGEVIQKRGKASMLVLAPGFQGWAPGEEWDDLSFFEENDQYMEKMAIVGEKKWEEPLLIFFGQGFRRCRVEYFLSEEVDKARTWLTEVPAE